MAKAAVIKQAGTDRMVTAKEQAEKKHLVGTAYSSVAAAVQAAKENMSHEDALLITGSFFIVGEAIMYLEKEAYLPLP